MATAAVSSATDAIAPATHAWALAASVLATSMAFLDAAALHVALPALQADLGASGVDLLWIVNAYALCLSALLLLGGAMGDRYGRRRLLMLGLAIFTAASLACGLAPDTPVLIVARAVQGLGAALLIPCSLAMLTAFTEPGRRGRAIGAWSAWTVVATALGPIMGGVLAGAGLWRGIFYLNLPLAAIALAILGRRVPESRDPAAAPNLDVAGAVALTIGLFGVTYSLIQAPLLGWGDGLVVCSLAGGVAALLVFVGLETRTVHVLVPLRLFRSRTLTGAIVLTLCLYGGFHTLVFFLPLNLIQAQGYHAAQAGLAQLPWMLLLVMFSRWAGSIADRQGPRLVLTLGPALAGCGFLLLALPGATRGPIDYWTHYLPALIVLGAGMALTCAPLSATLLAAVGTNQSGLASGINSTTARLAGLFALSTLGSAAIFVYQEALLWRGAEADLPRSLQQALHEQAAHLGNTPLLAGLDRATSAAAQSAIRAALIDAFRFVTVAAAALAWLGSLAAALLIASRAPHSSQAPRQDLQDGFS
jgi:EmrB/QacA subfamily drug resistance transporter